MLGEQRACARASNGSRGKETRSKQARAYGRRSPHERKREGGNWSRAGDSPSPAARVIPILPSRRIDRESRVFNHLIVGIVALLVLRVLLSLL